MNSGAKVGSQDSGSKAGNCSTTMGYTISQLLLHNKQSTPQISGLEQQRFVCFFDVDHF